MSWGVSETEIPKEVEKPEEIVNVTGVKRSSKITIPTDLLKEIFK